jgi:hypothetical protein
LEAVPDTKRLSWRLHRVGAGDSLPVIARRFGIQPSSILAANPALDALWFEQQREGELVLIPAAPRPEPVAKSVRAASTKKKLGSRGSAVARAGGKSTLHSRGASRAVQLASSAHAKARRTSNR